MNVRTAKLTIEYRPRIERVVVMRLGRVVCRCRDYEGARAFVKGWQDAEERRRSA